MWPFKENYTAFTTHSAKLTLARFLSLNVAPFPEALHLYAASLHFNQIYPGVHTNAFIFFMSPVTYVVYFPRLLKTVILPVAGCTEVAHSAGRLREISCTDNVSRG